MMNRIAASGFLFAALCAPGLCKDSYGTVLDALIGESRLLVCLRKATSPEAENALANAERRVAALLDRLNPSPELAAEVEELFRVLGKSLSSDEPGFQAAIRRLFETELRVDMKRADGGFIFKKGIGPELPEFRFWFQFVKLDSPDKIGLDRIVVDALARKQTLRIDFSACQFSRGELQLDTELVDLNGDGFEDLLVPRTGDDGTLIANSSYIWIYSPQTSEFIYCPELGAEGHLRPDGKGGVTIESGYGSNLSRKTFRWGGTRFELVGTYRRELRDGRAWEIQRTKQEEAWKEDFARPSEAEKTNR